MHFSVVLTAAAERDLEDIVVYIAEHDSVGRAEHVLSRILDAADGLAADPSRGSLPKELRELGIHDYRQVFFKPYRLIYRVIEQRVVIYLIADGRRDLQAVLAQRLLGNG